MKKKVSPVNIPRILRESLKPSLEKNELIKEGLEYLPELYPEKEEEYKSRKGRWRVTKRVSYSFPWFNREKKAAEEDGFFAVYYRDETPKTAVSGKTADSRIIRSILKIVSEKIIEQRFLFSRPAKSLTEDNGFFFGLRIGFIFAVLLGAFVLFDFFLIPHYPDAILKGLSISFSDGNWDSGNLRNYSSIVQRAVNALLPPETRPLAGSMYALAVVFILPILFFALVYEFAGKRADKKRIKYLPEEGETCIFGIRAFEKVSQEHRILKQEEHKNKFYKKLKDFGLKIRPEAAEEFYSDFFHQ